MAIVYGIEHGLHDAAMVAKLLALAVLIALLIRVLIMIGRFVAAPPAAKRNYPRAMWAGIRWRWLTHQMGLAYRDPHEKVKRRAPIGPAIGRDVHIQVMKGKMRYPRARFRADAYGLVANVKTSPRVGRAELERNSQHLADAWRCIRVQVSQPKPGRITVRGLLRDPLAEPFTFDTLKPSTYQQPGQLAATRLYLGRDEWAVDRHADLRGLTGITVGGLPRYGKTDMILWWLYQLAATGAVQFVFVDGKGGGDYAEWSDRAWLHCDDDLADAAGVLEDVHSLMRKRLRTVVASTGYRNAWHQGPTPDFPLIVTVVDECHTFFDLDAVKGQKEAEGYVRNCRTFAGQLVRKGGSVLMLTIFLTQKQTSDAIPTAIRDNCGLGFCFAVKTRDAAIAALGESIREYSSYCPTALQERPTYVGVATAALPTGSDPFVRLRVPEISEEAAAARAKATAHLRSDPSLAYEQLQPTELLPV
jgi:S-DNA-T family DNA segregation ATPase FtsK/SpoIIIE